MANANTSNLADIIKTMYEKRLLTRAVGRMVYGKWPLRARLNGFGTLEWRRYGALSPVTNTLTEGTNPAEQAAPTPTLITSTPSWYGAWVEWTHKMELTVFDDYLSELSGILGEQAALSADVLIRNVLTDGATKDYSGGVSGRTSLAAGTHDISYIDIVKVIAALETNNARPMAGGWKMIIHPHTYSSLMQDPVFVNMFTQETNDSAIRSGKMGRILNCEIYISSNARKYVDGGAVVGSATSDVYSAVILGEEAYGTVGFAGLDPEVVDSGAAEGENLTGRKDLKPVELIMKPRGSSGSEDPLDMRGTVGWKMAFEAKVLNSDFVIDLEHTNAHSLE